MYKRNQIKMRDYMDRQVTPPKRVTSPTYIYLRVFDWPVRCLYQGNVAVLTKTAFIIYTTGRGGRGGGGAGGRGFFGGKGKVFKFFYGKTGDDKNV